MFFKIHAEKMYEVFRDIQDMYVRLVSMLVEECEVILGKPPCKYAMPLVQWHVWKQHLSRIWNLQFYTKTKP